MTSLPEYTARQLQEMADRESARDHRRLRSLGIDPEGDPIAIIQQISRLHKALEDHRHQEP